MQLFSCSTKTSFVSTAKYGRQFTWSTHRDHDSMDVVVLLSVSLTSVLSASAASHFGFPINKF